LDYAIIVNMAEERTCFFTTGKWDICTRAGGRLYESMTDDKWLCESCVHQYAQFCPQCEMFEDYVTPHDYPRHVWYKGICHEADEWLDYLFSDIYMCSECYDERTK